MLVYDLKSAFHHISIMEKQREFLGLELVLDGEAKLIRFKAMPFGYKSRILMKVVRTLVCKWRKAEVPSFMHTVEAAMMEKRN